MCFTRGRNIRRAWPTSYDPLGLRIAKADTTFDVRGVKLRNETKRFVWEGLRLVQEVRETV